MIVIGNPASHFDTHGVFCEPKHGWDSINIDTPSWETRTGGLCLHFDGEKNPAVVHGDPRITWMQSLEDMKAVEDMYGKESFEYYRMVRGFWAPEGATNTIYSEAHFTQSGAVADANRKVLWGYRPPIKLAGFDPSYSAGGDRAILVIGELGFDNHNVQRLVVTEEVTVKIDITDEETPVPEQMAERFKYECEKRGVRPECACFDSSGAGVAFAALVNRVWSRAVRAVSSSGPPSEKPVMGEFMPDKKPVRAKDKYATRAAELWCAAIPYLRSGQIRNISREMAKEICSRQKAKNRSTQHLDKIQLEKKADYKLREKQSPDLSDAFFLLLNEAISRHGFTLTPTIAGGFRRHDEIRDALSPDDGRPLTPWQALKNRARRISNRQDLKRG